MHSSGEKYSLLQERGSADWEPGSETTLQSQQQKQHVLHRFASKTRQYAVLTLTLALLASLFVNIGLLSKWHLKQCSNKRPTQLYSPPQDLIEYEVVNFRGSIYNDKTPYQGVPTEESEALWLNLYRHLSSGISAAEAQLLPNKTAARVTENKDSEYVIALNVFHDLHCLHSIRKAIYYFQKEEWTASHNPYTEHGSADEALMSLSHHLRLEHLDHCIDVLRQSTQCASDITPNVYQMNPWEGKVFARSTVAHECRNFEKIRQWGEDHAIPNHVPWQEGAEELGLCAEDHPESCKEIKK